VNGKLRVEVPMRNVIRRGALLLSVGVLGLCLQACSRGEEGPGEKTGKAIDDAMRDAGEKMDEAAERMSESMHKAGKEMGRATEQMGEAMKEGGKKIEEEHRH
jgi:osmotically-inducible protein OsmY